MPTAFHPKRGWNFCMSEDEKKEIEPTFIDSVVHNLEVLRHFVTKIMHKDLI